MPGENKQRLKEYQKRHCKAKKSKLLSFFSLHGIKMEQRVLIFDKTVY